MDISSSLHQASWSGESGSETGNSGESTLSTSSVGQSSYSYSPTQNRAWVLSHAFGEIDTARTGPNWAESQGGAADARPYLRRWFQADENEQPPCDRPILQYRVDGAVELNRSELVARKVETLVLSLRSRGKCRGTIHIHLSSRCIQYYNDVRTSKFPPGVEERIQQVQSWMSCIDPGPAYTIDKEEPFCARRRFWA
jgi:hypothetical protein